uniref:Globin domain-containing protein n=1 Tax=Noctiluca scintillans TaxID=2966 RepID=A0A7S1AZ59_NOCSC
MSAAFNHLTTDMADDERVLIFLEKIEEFATAHAEIAATAKDASSQRASEAAEDGGVVAVEESASLEAIQNSIVATEALAQDINVVAFEELHLPEAQINAAQDGWRLFLSTSSSQESAGEAIYSALFEGAPSLQALFTTPRAVQAMRFLTCFSSFVEALSDPARLHTFVDTIGLRHLHLDVTIPRVVIFRDAILDLFSVELGEKFSQQAMDGWKTLLNYVGGAIIFVKTNYSERITLIFTSWKTANAKSTKESGSEEQGSGPKGKGSGDKTSRFKNMVVIRYKKTDNRASESDQVGQEHAQDGDDKTLAGGVPTTYPEMFAFNSAVMGFNDKKWMKEVLDCFHNIVTNVSNSARLQEECDVLALRISRVAKGSVNFADYKSCMLATLRAILPKDWSTSHEVAWSWLWENVERVLMKTMGKPPKWQDSLTKFYASLTEETKFEMRADIYARFFVGAPAGQDYFKQSNTYLHIIADKIMEMTLEIYATPVQMVDEISALGLRHVGYGIPTELFGPFVSACVEMLNTCTKDECVIDAFRWSLGLVSQMLVRTIQEGSTIVMKAITTNNSKLLRKAISCAPRGERASWTLLVQVGTQDISPLAWSIESGNLKAAEAIIKDLLSFRADRDRYYYGCDELFRRHPDIVQKLRDFAPTLLPELFDGLVWRSRTTEAAGRRVNYYIRHLLLNKDNSFAPALEWIAEFKDPRVVCHPIITLLSDMLWNRVSYWRFLYGKSWLLLTLGIFICSQSVVINMNEPSKEAERITTFACRVFVYGFSMTQTLFSHLTQVCAAYKNEETVSIFRVIKVPEYLRERRETASALVGVCLVVMLGLEPILHCWTHGEDNDLLFTSDCGQDDLKFLYSIFSALAMFLYFLQLIDLTVFSNTISAYVLVCSRMLSEFALFLLALAVSIVMFASAVSTLKHDDANFSGIVDASLSFLMVCLGMASDATIDEIFNQPVIFACVGIFIVTTIFFLLNLLIAQLTCAYDAIFADMVGYARLGRIGIIVETMPKIPSSKWDAFVASLRLDKPCEFGPGDLGVSGAIQVYEPASAHTINVDMISRFGGSTSVTQPWPSDNEEDDNDRFDRLEKIIVRSMKRVEQKKKGASGGGTTTGTSDSRSSQASEASSGKDE